MCCCCCCFGNFVVRVLHCQDLSHDRDFNENISLFHDWLISKLR